MVLEGFQSNKCTILSGVAQGSHLGPILFNIFINDLTTCFKYSTPYLYADDLFMRVVQSPDDSRYLQKDFNSVVQWCKINGMELHSSKCHHIKFSRKTNVVATQYSLQGEKLSEVKIIKDLGVILDSKLTFQSQIDGRIAKATKMLSFILRNSKLFKHSKTKIVLYNSLVRSQLEYCSIIWRPHYATHSLRLERVQKRFLWYLSHQANINKSIFSYNDRLKYFNMITLGQRRDLLDIMFLYKLLRNKIDCPNLLDKINFRIPYRHPRKPISLLVPPIKKTVFGANTVIPRLCKLYNKTCDSIDINADTLTSFKSSVINHIINQQ